MPFCRNHAAAGTARQEPWAFGPQVESVYRAALTLRYRLLPYLYSLFHEAAQTGAPILRPLLYHFPDDPVTYHLQDQVLLGPALLAAPVLRPGLAARAVYLPAGEWYDWHTGERHAGGRYHLAPAPLESLPLYARAGSVVPLGPVGRNTATDPAAPLTLRVFPGEGEFALYEDDGRTLAHERGEWALTRFVLRTTEAGVRLSWSREGRYAPTPRPVLIQVVGLGTLTLTDDGQPRTITL
jgi:alpha-glucosidase